jgi:multidrug efflux pump subunit AcrB
MQSGGMMMGGGGTDVSFQIFGYDIDKTTEIANEVLVRMREIKGTRDVDISRQEMKMEYQLDLDRDKLAAAGLSTAAVSTAIRNRINGLVASKFREDGDEYDITVRFDRPFREDLDNIENIVVFNSAGKGVKVKELGNVIERYMLPEISRENRQRVVAVNCNVQGRALGNVVEDVNAMAAEMNFPSGIYWHIGGNAEDQAESFGDMMTLLVLIVLLVFIVMASQFESLRMPFIIMISVLFAFTGVFITLYITGTTLSLIALIGAIMLVGIVVKNGIVLVDFTNILRSRGLSLSQSVIASGKSRMRPVLMTTLTTILGMIPLAVSRGEGAEMWRPMGIAIIGGLTFSTILTLIVVPVLYAMFGAGKIKSTRKSLSKANRQLKR